VQKEIHEAMLEQFAHRHVGLPAGDAALAIDA
jgi:hypothetical protein